MPAVSIARARYQLLGDASSTASYLPTLPPPPPLPLPPQETKELHPTPQQTAPRYVGSQARDALRQARPSAALHSDLSLRPPPFNHLIQQGARASRRPRCAPKEARRVGRTDSRVAAVAALVNDTTALVILPAIPHFALPPLLLLAQGVRRPRADWMGGQDVFCV